MTVNQLWSLTCTQCGRSYAEQGETGQDVRDLASDDGWKSETVQNGSLWDFCPRCTAERRSR